MVVLLSEEPVLCPVQLEYRIGTNPEHPLQSIPQSRCVVIVGAGAWYGLLIGLASCVNCRPRRLVTGLDESSVSDKVSGTVGDPIGPPVFGIDDCALGCSPFCLGVL